MSDEGTGRRFDQETAEAWNRESGIEIHQGSNYAKEMAKWEQFPSKYCTRPGNPYVYRPFPKMVYRAELWKGVPYCMAPPPNPVDFSNPGEFNRVEEAARQFTERCQRTVRDERELQIAMEQGYREAPGEAVDLLKAKMERESRAAAERNWQDRLMSEGAKAEAKVEAERIFTDEGRHAAEIPEKPIRRRGRPRKNVA